MRKTNAQIDIETLIQEMLKVQKEKTRERNKRLQQRTSKK